MAKLKSSLRTIFPSRNREYARLESNFDFPYHDIGAAGGRGWKRGQLAGAVNAGDWVEADRLFTELFTEAIDDAIGDASCGDEVVEPRDWWVDSLISHLRLHITANSLPCVFET